MHGRSRAGAARYALAEGGRRGRLGCE
jgi:hypothetical protein